MQPVLPEEKDTCKEYLALTNLLPYATCYSRGERNTQRVPSLMQPVLSEEIRGERHTQRVPCPPDTYQKG